MNSHIFKRHGNKILVETKSELANSVLLCDEFKKRENSPFKTMELFNSITIGGQSWAVN